MPSISIPAMLRYCETNEIVRDTSSVNYVLRFNDTIEDNTLETEITWLLDEGVKESLLKVHFDSKDMSLIQITSS